MQVNQHSVEQEEVMAYLDGELASDRAATVAAHLEDCGECRQLAAELRDVSQQLSGWRVDAPMVKLRRKFPVWKILGVVAAACLLFIVFLARPRAHFQYSPASASVSMGKLPTVRTNPPMIAKSSQLALVTKEFDKARGSVEDILKRHGGYLGQLDVAEPGNGPRTLSATLRIPTAQLDPAITEIKKLGEVESESQSGEEVTQQYVDLDARLTNARNTEQRLSTLLHDRAGQMNDVLAVEKEIDRVRGEIEQMEAEKKTLVNRVDYATLTVTIREVAKAQLLPHPTLERFRNAAVEGYSGLMDAAVGLTVVLLSYGPAWIFWIVLIALVFRLALKSTRVRTLLKFGSRNVE
jgi:hypothetical protein